MDEPRIKVSEFTYSDEVLEQRWVEACRAMEAAIVEWWGQRCDEYCEDCECCKRWRAYDELIGCDETEIDDPTDTWVPSE